MTTAPPEQHSSEELASKLHAPWRGIRQDLVVYQGPRDDDGHRTWVVEDPVRGATFRLGPTEGMLFAALARHTDLQQALHAFYKISSARPTTEDLLSFLQMMQRERLTNLPPESAVEMDKRPETGGPPEAQSWRTMALHAYVFFRIPIARPDRFLERWWPWAQLLAAPLAWMLYLFLGVMGVFLTAPQIELYLSTTSYLLTPQGAATFLVVLVVLKIGHELAHAFTAKAQGLHVRSMGVAFILLWPILYTDTTDAWKLDHYRKRLKIDSAGVVFELVVGGVALFFWALLPDGVLKSVMFFLSGISIVSSLFINLNPFMRFDGYYILMDLWRLDNLQPRAFALMKHKLRRLLFDWQAAPPERHPKETRMVMYAIGTSFYRVLIALAIGLAVYHLFFKALGIIVFLIEMWMFLIRPVWIEAAYVIKHRSMMGSRLRLMVSGLAAMLFVGLLTYPIPRVEVFPGLVVWGDNTPVLAPVAGFLDRALPEKGAWVDAGDEIVVLRQPDVDQAIQEARFRLRMVDAELASMASGGEQGGYRGWLLAERERLIARLATVIGEKQSSRVHAPVAGEVVLQNENIQVADMVEANTPLLVISRPDRRHIVAYVHEKALALVPEGPVISAECHFSDLETPAQSLRLVERGQFPVTSLPNEVLLDRVGGPIVASPGEEGAVPLDAYFAFEFQASRLPDYLRHGTPCSVWIQADNRSLASTAIGGIGRVLAQEGFI